LQDGKITKSIFGGPKKKGKGGKGFSLEVFEKAGQMGAIDRRNLKSGYKDGDVNIDY